MHEFDKASRYLVKQDPFGCFRWLWQHEPDVEVRTRLGAFALVFARQADRDELWKQALEDWGMRKLQEVDYWHSEGRAEGQLEARREDLVALLEKRFWPLTPTVVRPHPDGLRRSAAERRSPEGTRYRFPG
jgi:hypothetical protein